MSKIRACQLLFMANKNNRLLVYFDEFDISNQAHTTASQFTYQTVHNVRTVGLAVELN